MWRKEEREGGGIDTQEMAEPHAIPISDRAENRGLNSLKSSHALQGHHLNWPGRSSGRPVEAEDRTQLPWFAH